jgi:hypothetical protein
VSKNPGQFLGRVVDGLTDFGKFTGVAGRNLPWGVAGKPKKPRVVRECSGGGRKLGN